jgi:hypothetical protein
MKCIYAIERGYHPSRSVESIHIHCMCIILNFERSEINQHWI